MKLTKTDVDRIYEAVDKKGRAINHITIEDDGTMKVHLYSRCWEFDYVYGMGKTVDELVDSILNTGDVENEYRYRK